MKKTAWLTDLTQRCISYAKEARLADQGMISYRTAVGRTFDRREAFALARPYSAFVVGRGTSFLYRDGVLCYQSQKRIRILNVHDVAREEILIDLTAVGRWLVPARRHSHVELLQYRAGILSFLNYLEDGPKRQRWLIVMDLRYGEPMMRLCIVINRPRIWVRNNDQYLYVGCHNGQGDDGHREWNVQGYELLTGTPLAVLALPNFWGTDLRETIVFEIFDGYLYAVSNRSSFEMEEIDWTSFYFCLRVPVDDPIASRLQRKDIWRRQHVEGPINDSWTDLGLHRDERTGELLIIEARKEWRNGVGAQKRTFYIERLDGTGWSSEDGETSDPQSPSASSLDLTGLPTPLPNEPIAKLLEKGDRPLYADPRHRLHCQYYPESPGSEPPSDEFPISRTRYRTFLAASSAFLDVVLDHYPLPTPESPHPPRTGQQQIRLRIGARLRASPLDPDPRNPEKRVLRPLVLDEKDGHPLPESADRFGDRGIRLWPPANAPTELIELLNRGRGYVDEISVMEDERSLVYQAAPSSVAGDAERNIILINFDRGVRHPGLPLLRWPGMDEPASANVPAVTMSGQGSERREEGIQFAKWGPVRTDVSGPRSGGAVMGPGKGDWWSRELAMYLHIKEGYRFK